MARQNNETESENAAHGDTDSPDNPSVDSSEKRGDEVNDMPTVDSNRQQVIELASRFKDGDELAFNELAEKLGRRAYYMALKSTGSPDLAEDIAQDSLVKVYHYIHRLQELKTIMNWHYRIVLNLINDYYRKHARHIRSGEKLIRIRELEEKSRVEALSEPDREELATVIQDAISHLDERHRTVFILKEIQHETHANIARMLDIPVGTVWSRLSHAREKLQRYLKARGFTA